MAQCDNLYRRSSGIYVVRLAVPARYRLYTVQREIHALTKTNCKHTRFSSTHFLSFPGFQPSAGTLPASGYSGIYVNARCYIPSANSLLFRALYSGF